MPIQRFGVEMSHLKAGIVDMIVRGGDDGTPVKEIFSTLFATRNCSRASLHAHVWQINEKLMDEGYRIIGVRDHNSHHSYDRYRMIRVGVKEVA